MYKAWIANTTAEYPGALPPPPGVTADTDHPPSGRRSVLIATLVVSAVVSTLFFFTRVYVKLRVTRKVLLEDVVCAISWVLFMLFLSVTSTMVYYGEGYHGWDITDEAYSQILKWLYALGIVYSPTAFFIKTTLLLIEARVFAVRRRVAKGIYIFIVATFLAYCPTLIMKIVVCSPIKAYWSMQVQGSCLNQYKMFLADICVAIVTDLCILVIPIPVTWTMRIPVAKKIKIVALLGIGGIGTGVAIYRLIVAIPFVDETDTSYDFVILHVTTMIELTIGIICSCFPSVNILVEKSWSRVNKLPPNSPRSTRKLQRMHPASTGIVASWWGSGISENGTSLGATPTGNSSAAKGVPDTDGREPPSEKPCIEEGESQFPSPQSEMAKSTVQVPPKALFDTVGETRTAEKTGLHRGRL